MSTTSNPLLEAKGITKYFGTITALENVNLKVHAGECLGVVGDNKLGGDLNPKKISYRSKDIKCGRESCNSCPHGPYWYAEWTESGKRKTKYLGKKLNEIIE